VALVSDALLLLRYANKKILVVRHKFTPRMLFSSILNDLEKRKIAPLSIIINDEKPGLNGYGYDYAYGYGYGYGFEHEPEKSFLKEVFRKILSQRR